MAATTAVLSDSICIDFPFQSFPQMAVAMIMGIISFIDMCWAVRARLFQGNYSQREPHIAPQPQVPDASDTIVRSGERLVSVLIMAEPFQPLMKVAHH